MDTYLWLEERNGAEATAWAKSQSDLTKIVFEKDARFPAAFQEISDIYTSTDKIPMISLKEGYAYNLWQDDKHKRGLWRRTTLAEYKKPQPNWEVLIDFDELAQKENQPWVFKGSFKLKNSDRTLVYLSKNGQDATEVREFSLSQKTFIPNGFFFPESKSDLTWFDENHLLVSPTLTEDQKTTSGYPRKTYFWTRGEAFSKAKLLFEGELDDVSIRSYVDYDHNLRRAFISRAISFYQSEKFFLKEDLTVQKMPMPMESWILTIFKDQVFFELKVPWKDLKAGTLVAVPWSAMSLPDIPQSQIQVVFEPGEHSALAEMISTQESIYLLINENVRGQVHEAKLGPDNKWQLEQVFKDSDNSFYISAVDDSSDAVVFQEEGYLQPRRLVLREKGQVSELKRSKSYFNESAFVTEQFWAKSKDGVEIPYTVIRSKNLQYNSQNPTLLYGYGGFEVSLMPAYSGVMGKAWLEKGGVHVVANIRGGGEFGPDWHRSAILENKQRSYDDFIAIAEDLIVKKITSPDHLGIQGGSNGGLLVGAVTMQRPDLFKAVVCAIPLLDMIRYMKLPPGSSWSAEYGDPEDPKMQDVIIKYSPYQNISKTKQYPKIFFKTTQADDRVHPGHARKMAARMKEFGHEIFYFESTDGGHGGGGVKLEDQARTSAYVYIYLLQQLK